MDAVAALIIVQTINLCGFEPTFGSVREMLNNFYVPTMGTSHYVAKAICKQLDNPFPNIYTMQTTGPCKRVNNVCIEGKKKAP